jgi:hypothetical protein
VHSRSGCTNQPVAEIVPNTEPFSPQQPEFLPTSELRSSSLADLQAHLQISGYTSWQPPRYQLVARIERVRIPASCCAVELRSVGGRIQGRVLASRRSLTRLGCRRSESAGLLHVIPTLDDASYRICVATGPPTEAAIGLITMKRVIFVALVGCTLGVRQLPNDDVVAAQQRADLAVTRISQAPTVSHTPRRLT